MTKKPPYHTHESTVDSSKDLLLACGGTAGHVYPALALAQQWQKRGGRVRWVVDARGAKLLEARDVHGSNTALDIIAVRGVVNQTPVGKIGALLLILYAVVRLGVLWVKRRPLAVAGFGGYVSVPAVIAAVILRIPVVLHEQNAVVGRANALLARMVGSVYCSHLSPRGVPQGIIAHYVPMPLCLRRETETLGKHGLQKNDDPLIGRDYPTAVPTTPINKEKMRVKVIVTGGTLGAVRLTEAVMLGWSLLDRDALSKVTVFHQVHRDYRESTRAQYQKIAMDNVVIESFFSDLPQLIKDADFVVCRAGAVTLAEINALATGAIIWPLVTHDGHQNANAQELIAQCKQCYTLIDETCDVSTAGHQLAREFAERITAITQSGEGKSSHHYGSCCVCEAAPHRARLDGARELSDAIIKRLGKNHHSDGNADHGNVDRGAE